MKKRSFFSDYFTTAFVELLRYVCHVCCGVELFFVTILVNWTIANDKWLVELSKVVDKTSRCSKSCFCEVQDCKDY